MVAIDAYSAVYSFFDLISVSTQCTGGIVLFSQVVQQNALHTLVAGAGVDCGEKHELSFRIVGGHTTVRGAWKWQVRARPLTELIGSRRVASHRLTST